MQPNFWTAALLGFLLIAVSACGGGGDGARIMDLEERLAEAEQTAEEAEQAAAEAEAERLAAEEEALQAEQEAAAAEAERLAAEEEALQAEQEAAAAEAERLRLEQEAEKARQEADAAVARRALAGTRTRGGATLDATPGYNAPASITAPDIAGTPSTGSMGRWLKTTLADRTGAMHDVIEIYSDVEAPKGSDFATSSYNSGNSVINAEGEVIGSVTIANADHTGLVASGSFPSTSGTPQRYNLVDRGPTQGEIDADDDISGTGRDETRYPSRYMAELSGRFHGASGRFRCGDNAGTTSCTVQNRGGTFWFGGTWQFVPSSGTVKILIDDAEHMWFGWWSRYTVADDSWAFVADHGGNVLTDVAAVTGMATYRGQAAGRYAIFEPATGDSGAGNFTASAELRADFDADSVSGSITGFSNAPNWKLTLNAGDITAGAVAVDTNGVTWSINDVPVDSGAWEADFYSNLPTAESTGVVPYGIAGTFQADYGSTGRLIGAFGAHR